MNVLRFCNFVWGFVMPLHTPADRFNARLPSFFLEDHHGAMGRRRPPPAGQAFAADEASVERQKENHGFTARPNRSRTRGLRIVCLTKGRQWKLRGSVAHLSTFYLLNKL